MVSQKEALSLEQNLVKHLFIFSKVLLGWQSFMSLWSQGQDRQKMM